MSLSQRIAAEREAQKLWRPRSGNNGADVFWRVLENEFLAPGEQAARARRRLRGIVAYCATAVPYYRDLFARLKLRPEHVRGPEDLVLLPELDKTAILKERRRLCPERLPAGEHDGGSNASSGTTGAPVKVFRTLRTRQFDILFVQRQLRWYRFDPAGSMASLRVAENLAHVEPGRPIRLGESVKAETWTHLGGNFVTGPNFGFDSRNPMTEKIAWLDQIRPAYIHTTTAQLEHFALAMQEGPKLGSLRGLRAISEPLTPGMEARIEDTLGAPVHISYGMDEIGWVATRCEAGRYHVHAERFIAEIVDEDGEPCAPGEFGRVLVTDTANSAMPLLRYVTDDIAQAVEGPCPCGRTLPAIGPITGRYSQTESLPAGSLEIATALREAMEWLPPDLSAPLREYQVRQTRAGNFELHLVLAGTPAPGFSEYIGAAWRRALTGGQSGNPTLAIRAVAEIPRTPSLKFMHFVSEITPPRVAKDYAPSAGDAAAPFC